MKTFTVLSLSALLMLGTVHAQPVAPTQAPPLTDVPTSNFAKAAVDLLVARGIVMGYPDGTFRGAQAVSRYELAVILARVLGGNLLSTSSAQAALQPGDLEVITKGMQDVAAQITTIDTRLRDALTDIDALRARLGDTERALEGVIAVAVTRSELEAQLTAARKEVAEQMALTESQTQAALTTKADQVQVTELQAQVAELQAKIKAAEDKAAEDLAAPAGPTFSVTPENVPNATFEDDRPGQSASNPGGSSLYFGGGIGITPGAATGYTVMVGSEEVLRSLGGLGLRVSADLGSTSGFAVQANLTRNFAGGRFSPYAGLGAGVFVSPQIAAVAAKPGEVVDPKAAKTNTNDLYVSVLTGTNYNFTETLRLFAEADARYALSTRGQATSGTAFGFKLRGGVKLYF